MIYFAKVTNLHFIFCSFFLYLAIAAVSTIVSLPPGGMGVISQDMRRILCITRDPCLEI